MRLFRKKIPKDNSQIVQIQNANGTEVKTTEMLIPKEEAQTVTEVESFTVSWKIKTGWSDSTASHFKVFVDEDEAKEFKKTARRMCQVYQSLDKYGSLQKLIWPSTSIHTDFAQGGLKISTYKIPYTSVFCTKGLQTLLH